MPKRLFPDVPEDLAALGDESLADLLGGFRETSGKLKNGEIDLAEFFGDDLAEGERDAEAMRQWTEAAETVRSIRAIQGERLEAEARFAEEAETLHAEFEDEAAVGEATDEAREGVEAPADGTEVELAADPKEDDDDEDEKPDEDAEKLAAESPDETSEVVEEAEAILASATEIAKPVIRFPAVSKKHTPEVPLFEDDSSPVHLVAAGGNRNAKLVEGTRLNRDEYADAIVRVAKSYGPVVKTKDGSRERILVASAQYEYPEERRLYRNDPEGNVEKLAKVGNYFLNHASRAVLMAQGGICAPPVPFYDLPGFGTTARPVRAFLPSFQADRGGVSIPGVTTIADIMDGDAITVITAAEDAEGGTVATKSCMAQECAEWTDTFVTTIAHCRTFGNLNARTWPEGVAHENDLTMVGVARTAEGYLLDRLDALSIAVTGKVTYGASSSLLYALSLSRVGMISRLRLDPNTRVQALLPFWAADMFALDLVNGATGGADSRFDTPASAVSALFSRFGIDVGWHLDEGLDDAATTEIWPAEDGTLQEDWPGSTVIARVFLPGTFLHLDGGELELGLIRDSTLNEVNDHEFFGEEFGNLARVGPAQAAHRVSLAICPDGTIAAPDTSPFTCSAT